MTSKLAATPFSAPPIQPAGFPGLPEGWIAEAESFRSCDGKTDLFATCLRKEPLESHRALVLIHGMGEHSARYWHAPHYLQQEVQAIHCFDLPGHGRSGGTRGHIERFDSMADDLAAVIRRLDERLRKQFGKSEIHLFAHSLGGHIAVRMLLANPDIPLASATASAPFLGIKQKVPAAKKAAAMALAGVWPSLQLDTALDDTGLSHDQAVIEAYRSDRLNHSKMTPGFFKQLLAAFDDTLSKHEGIRVPLQFLVPLADRIVEAEKSIQFFNALKHNQKLLRIYPDFYHEPVNEIGKEKVFEDIADWIRRHHR